MVVIIVIILFNRKWYFPINKKKKKKTTKRGCQIIVHAGTGKCNYYLNTKKKIVFMQR